MDRNEPRIKFNSDKKFDLQLGAGLIAEKRLADIFSYRRIERIELKTENWLWERTGNIGIEYAWNGKPSGISTTTADYWVHALERDGELLCYLMFPVDLLHKLVCEARLMGRCRQGGDNGQSRLALVRLADLLQ